jgi:hypothetical protein
MTRLKAGTAYFAILFSLGFVLGTLRVLILAPRIGELASTALELPLMLTASWYVCGWVIEKMRLVPDAGNLLSMGAIAFVFLMVAELLLGLAFGRSLDDQCTTILQQAGLLGFLGQVVFGLVPWLRFAKRVS